MNTTARDDVLISVIIVNYNVKPFLQQCLVSLQRAMGDIPHEIIVVDNHSVDGSPAMLKEQFPEVRVIVNRYNLGFSRANNQALAQAHGKYLWLLNPDTLVQEDTPARLLEVMESDPRIGILGCKILNPDGSLQLACRRSFPTLWVAFTKLIGLAKLFPKTRLFGRYNLTYLDPDKAYEVEAISGSCMFVRAEAMQEVGLLDEEFFMYGEDLDWCFRFKQAGWKVFYTPSTSIVHYKGESSRLSPLDVLTHFYHSMEIFARKHFKTRWWHPLRWLLRAGIWGRFFLSLTGRVAKTGAAVLLDMGGILLITVGAIFLRFHTLTVLDAYKVILPIYLVIWFFTLNAFGMYGKNRYALFPAITAATLGFLVNVTLTFFFRQFAFSRQVLLLSYLGIVIWLPLWRSLAAERRKLGNKIRPHRVLVVGAPEQARNILQRLKRQVQHMYEPLGIIVPDGQNLEGEDAKGSLDDLTRLVQELEVEEVVFAADNPPLTQVFTLLPVLSKMGVKIKLVPGNLAFIIGKSSVEQLQEVPLFDMDFRYLDPARKALKRAEDWLQWLILAVIVRPLRALGLGHFGLLGERLGNLKLVRQGKWSVIGAPPDLPEILPLDIKPGLISLEDLRGGSENYSEEERLALLNYYLQNQSFWLDMEIFFRALMG